MKNRGGGDFIWLHSFPFKILRTNHCWQLVPDVALGEIIYMFAMVIRVVEFSNGGYKIRKIFAKESTYSKEIIEFWESG